MNKKYKVKIGDFAGGYVTVGKDLTLEQAKKLQKKEWENCDWFTVVHIVNNDNDLEIIQ